MRMKTLMIFYGIWNVVVAAVYGADKLQAKRGRRRVPEKVLLAGAFLMGGAGALLGMILFRHKTQHLRFKILVPLFLAMNIAALWWIGTVY